MDPTGQHLLWGSWTGPYLPVGPVAADPHGNLVTAERDPTSFNDYLRAAKVSTESGAPQLLAGCFYQSGSPYLSGAIAPGELLSIIGAGYGPENGMSAVVSADNKIGMELGGVQVLIENVPAPLLYVSGTKIDLVAPYEIADHSAAHIHIVTSEASSNEVVLPVVAAAPEIFESEWGVAAVLNPNGTINSLTNAAHRGDVLTLFASGVGQMDPPGIDGEIPQTSTRKPLLPIRLHLTMYDGYENDAAIAFAGEAPLLVSGVVQVNFRVPDDLPNTAGGLNADVYVELIVNGVSVPLSSRPEFFVKF
jgi:uncharacterized protein (TIGR03437 family)